jgi:hypothetical protein
MQIRSLSLSALADVLAKMNITESRDMGGVQVHTGTLPDHEECATVQNAISDKNVLITFDDGNGVVLLDS